MPVAWNGACPKAVIKHPKSSQGWVGWVWPGVRRNQLKQTCSAVCLQQSPQQWHYAMVSLCLLHLVWWAWPMDAIRIHGHESILVGPLVKMSISMLSARAATAVPPQHRARLCRLGLGSAMPDLCSVLASPTLDVVHALAAPINAYFFFCLHPPALQYALGCWLPGMVPAPKLLSSTQGHHRVGWAGGWSGVRRNRLKQTCDDVCLQRSPQQWHYAMVSLCLLHLVWWAWPMEAIRIHGHESIVEVFCLG